MIAAKLLHIWLCVYDIVGGEEGGESGSAPQDGKRVG